VRTWEGLVSLIGSRARANDAEGMRAFDGDGEIMLTVEEVTGDPCEPQEEDGVIVCGAT
jgi:hypothetical protein